MTACQIWCNIQSMEKEDKIEQNKTWEELTRKFSNEVGDKLGKGIDNGAVQSVVGLNALGFETSGSCEGHLDHGAPGPYLDLRSREAELFMGKFDLFWEELGIIDPSEQYGNRLNPEQMARWDKLHEAKERLIEEKNVPALAKLLLEFHQVYPQGNFVAETGPEWVRIEPGDIEEQSDRSIEEQQKYLKTYQQELAAFAEFLKQKFMSKR